MGKQKLSRADFIAAHPRCCYCNGRRPTAEIDHAPARIVFVKKHGPEGFEFPSCSECNRLSALSEQVMAFYIRCFDLINTEIDDEDFSRLTTAIANNAPDALPILPTLRPQYGDYFDPAIDLENRTATITPKAKEHVDLFTMKMLYAIYYRVTGKFAGSSTRYLRNWAQTGTPAASQMEQWAEAWFGEYEIGKRKNVDLGNQFSFQTGYHPRHGVCGMKMAFGGAFVMFGVIGPALDMKRGKLELPLCPSISHLGKKLNKRKV